MLHDLTVVLSVLVGFFTFNIMTHPYSLIWNSFPQVKTKRFQVFPSIKITVGNRTIWFHHWVNFTIILLITLTPLITGGILDALYTRGFLIGGVLQGLSIPDSRKIIR